MRVTIQMNDELGCAIKLLAHWTGRTFSEVLEQAARDLLTKSARTATRCKLRLPVSGSPDKKLTLQQLEDAIYESDLEYDLKKIRSCFNNAGGH